MSQFLLFTLAAPLASFGAVAVGGRRPTWDRPGKSQVIGLVASALGIERSDEDDQRQFTAGLGFAVRVDDPGALASDYHTAQSAKDVEIRRWTKKHGPIRTRADELDCADLKTTLSQREFRTDSHCTICLWRLENAECQTLDDIAKALQAPKFAPYAGRKAHPLMLPMAPRIVEADCIEAAFALFDADIDPMIADLLAERGISRRVDRQWPVFADASAVPSNEREARVAQMVERRDIPESRSKWRFGLRTEVLLRTGGNRGR